MTAPQTYWIVLCEARGRGVWYDGSILDDDEWAAKLTAAYRKQTPEWFRNVRGPFEWREPEEKT